jgi:hypothetical protein
VIVMPAALLSILAQASASPTLVNAGGGHGGGRPWIAVAAFAVLVIGLIVRLVAGRRLRRSP